MKQLLMCCLTVIVLAACATLTPEQKVQRAQQVEQAINNRHLYIDVRTAQSARGFTRHVNDYSLEISNDTVRSYLPYYGRAWNVPYGGGSALNFTELTTDWTVTQPKAGQWKLRFTVRHEQDEHLYSIDLYDNGAAYISVQSRERELMNYEGAFDFDRK